MAILSTLANSGSLQQAIDWVIANPLLAAVVIPIILAAGFLAVYEAVRYSNRIPGFDGPTGYPIWGNIPQIRENAAEKYRQWSLKYGPVYQVQLGNVPILVVNSAEKAKEVFLTNSRATSSRPMFHTFHKVVSSTAGFTIGTTPMNESLKRRRKAAATALNRNAVNTYMPHIDLETEEFVRECYEIGQAGKVAIDPMPIVQRMSLNMSLTLNWGARIDSINDPLFKEIIEVEELISHTRSTTDNWQDYVPLLRWNIFKKADKTHMGTRARRDVYITKMNKELDEKMAKGTHKPCIQANVLSDPEAKLNAEELMGISLTMISGGLDTVTTLTAWACAILAARPDIQEKCYNAIREMYSEDEIMCDPMDDQKCVYVAAFVRECLRYFNVLRLSLPRSVEQDFKYEGKIIKKGTIIFLNAWACNMDPELYKDPYEFKPERFIENPLAPIFSYGVGSRMCAGFLLGNRELYFLMMRLISAFNIHQADEIDLNPLTGAIDATALVSQPKKFAAKFQPRNNKALKTALDNFVPCSV